MARERAAAQATAQTATEAAEASRRETAAAAEATAATLQAAHDALVARIPQPAARVRDERSGLSLQRSCRRPAILGCGPHVAAVEFPRP